MADVAPLSGASRREMRWTVRVTVNGIIYHCVRIMQHPFLIKSLNWLDSLDRLDRH